MDHCRSQPREGYGPAQWQRVTHALASTLLTV
jgi:hypothetical protein